MKKILSFILVVTSLVLLAACQNTKPPKPDPDPTPDPEPQVLTVAQVLEQPDFTEVTFKGIVIGFDSAKKHIVVEDKDGKASVQLFKNPGYQFVKLGDEVLVSGTRTYDRQTDRVAPDTLERISSDNPSSLDNPIVIDGANLKQWTNENRTNANILFKFYRFTNVKITSVSDSYTFIDDKYDEEGGRGLKIGIKNDSSVYPASNFVVGQTYSFSALVYGSSDDFFDENRDGTVLRLSVLRESDVEMVNDGEDALVVVNGRKVYKPNEAEKPDFKTYFKIVDPIDGEIVVTDDMITEQVDMTAVGRYPVLITFVNSEGHKTEHSFDFIITETGVSVTEAIHLGVNSFVYVQGVVSGYGLNKDGKGAKRSMIIEDPMNGKSIEIWATGNPFKPLNVGDNILLSGTIQPEKSSPRLNNATLLEVLSTGNELFAPRVITDLNAWTLAVVEASKEADLIDVLGRYTFTATVVHKTSAYIYFTYGTEETGFIFQFAIHQEESVVKYDWVVGNTYTVTGVLYQVSDKFSDLETKSIVTRIGIMNQTDIILVENTDTPEK